MFKVSRADLRPQYVAWITAPLPSITLPAPSLSLYLEYAPTPISESVLASAEQCIKTYAHTWSMCAYGLNDIFVDSINQIKKYGRITDPLFSFHCGPENNRGSITLADIPDTELKVLFSDMPFIEFNVQPNHHFIRHEPLLDLLGISLQFLTIFDLRVIYAIIHDRLTSINVTDYSRFSPDIDISVVKALRPSYTPPRSSLITLPIVSADNYAVCDQSDLRSFLAHTFEALHAQGKNPMNLGSPTTGWKCNTTYLNPVTKHNSWVFTYQNGYSDVLKVNLEELGPKLIISSILGLPSCPFPTRLVLSEDFV